VDSETFGLAVGENNSFKKFATFGRLISQSQTIYHALQTVCQFVQLHTTVSRFWLGEAGGKIWFCRGQLEGPDVGLQQMEQYTLAQMLRVVRLGAGRQWLPSEIRVCAAENPRLEETESLSGAHVQYGQPFTAIAVPRSIISRRISPHDSPKCSDNRALEEQLRSMAPSDDFPGTLRQVIESHLHSGPLSIVEAAEITYLHARTLQRRLSEYSLTYQQVVDQARFQRAIRLLENSKIKVTDIAYELGYSDGAHFSRAFRRLAGVSPREYRSHQSAA
jgi:AraC-like DNA-binding protein